MFGLLEQHTFARQVLSSKPRPHRVLSLPGLDRNVSHLLGSHLEPHSPHLQMQERHLEAGSELLPG